MGITLCPEYLVVCEMVDDPGKYTYFTNQNTAGKVVYYWPFIEEVEIYFTDWGDRLSDDIEYTCVLTFDFTERTPLPEPTTMKRARRFLAMSAEQNKK
jgi:hypothetical protein